MLVQCYILSNSNFIVIVHCIYYHILCFDSLKAKHIELIKMTPPINGNFVTDGKSKEPHHTVYTINYLYVLLKYLRPLSKVSCYVQDYLWKNSINKIFLDMITSEKKRYTFFCKA